MYPEHLTLVSVRDVALDSLLYVAGQYSVRYMNLPVRQFKPVRNISPVCRADVYITALLIRHALLSIGTLQHAASGSSDSYIWYIFILMTVVVQWLALLLLTYESLALNLCTQIG